MFKQSLRNTLLPAATLFLVGAASPLLHAQCRANFSAVKPAAYAPSASGARLIQAGFQPGDPFGPKSPIVGMWHVLFTAKTMNGGLIPDTVIDSALVAWHDDKTEIMNSGRPPQDGNFCLGVWEEIGPRTYQLNHFAWAGNDAPQNAPAGTVGSPIGPVHYKEIVTVGPEGKHYSGQFTLDQYDTAGKIAVSFTGTLKATRITIDTTAKDLLQ